MLNLPKQYLYLVVDQINKSILASCSSASIANAVSTGIFNSSPMTIWFPYVGTSHPIIKYNSGTDTNYTLVRQSKTKFNNIDTGINSDSNIYKLVNETPSGRMFDLEPMDPALIDEAWIQKRKLANFRTELMTSLEVYCERYISRNVTFCADELLFPYLQKQIDECDPEQDYYDPDNFISNWLA